MPTRRISPRINMGIIHASHIHVDDLTDYSYITANNGGCIVNSPPALRYNEGTSKWQFSNDGITFQDLGTGTGASGSLIVDKTVEHISSDIAAESLHTLPSGKSYTPDNGNNLDIYFNGQLLAHDSGSITYDYEEINSVTIRFHREIPTCSVLSYIIRN